MRPDARDTPPQKIEARRLQQKVNYYAKKINLCIFHISGGTQEISKKQQKFGQFILYRWVYTGLMIKKIENNFYTTYQW